MNPQLGGIAALTTALLWSGTSSFFTMAGRSIGSVTVNRFRLILALLFLLLAHTLVMGAPLPLSAAPERWMWLSISGVIGLVLGDAFLFQAFLWIGPRLSMLLMSLAPLIAAFSSALIVGEHLRGGQWFGVVLSLSGVALVVSDRRFVVQEQAISRRRMLRGVVFGIAAATGQALGLVTSKLGLAGDFSALSANLIRMLAAATVMWTFTILTGRARISFRRLRAHPASFGFLLGGAFTGPFLGVWLSLVAIQNTTIGVASTLMSLTPIFLLPIGRIFFHEAFGWRSWVGTLVALGGVSALFLL